MTARPDEAIAATTRVGQRAGEGRVTGPFPQIELPPIEASEPAGRRFVYLLLLRVAVTTLLLIAAAASDIASPVPLAATWGALIFTLLAMTYGLTLLWALLLRRGVSPTHLAAMQTLCDAATTTCLVHADGGAGSGFVFLYLLLIGGGAMVLPARGTGLVTAGVCLAYLAASVLAWSGVEAPWSRTGIDEEPIRELIFTVAKNLVFFVATAALSRRLAAELEGAAARIAAQGVRLHNLETLHDDVVRSLTSGLLTLSNEGFVLSLNPVGSEILGVDAAGVTGRALAEINPALAEIVCTRAAAEGQRREEHAIERPDGTTRFLGLSISPLIHTSGEAVGRVVNFQDLTDLRGMKQQVARAERLAAVGRLAAAVAHEIRNPLAAISGSIQLMRTTVPSEGDTGALMEIVVREVDRLDRLITEMLDFARPPRPSPTPLDVGGVVGDVVRVVENDPRICPRPGRVRLAAQAPA